MGADEPLRTAGGCGSPTRRASTTTPRRGPRTTNCVSRRAPSYARRRSRRGWSRCRRPPSTRTWTTGARRWWPSTSTAATRCSRSRGTRSSIRKKSSDPDDCTWVDVSDASMTMADYLAHHLYTAPGPELSEIALVCARTARSKTARRIMATTHDALRYVRGVTSVHTSADEAYADGAGVCQDFAHLALALTKSVGLPSRYVSGYFHPDAGRRHRRGDHGESHAWVEVWTGRWWAYDPTNDCPVGERHVAVGRGRDYGDVPPVKGIYAGNAENTMRVGGAHGESPLSGGSGLIRTAVVTRADQNADLAARRAGRPGRCGSGDRGRPRQRHRSRGARTRGGGGDRRARGRAARRSRGRRRRLPGRAQRSRGRVSKRSPG